MHTSHFVLERLEFVVGMLGHGGAGARPGPAHRAAPRPDPGNRHSPDQEPEIEPSQETDNPDFSGPYPEVLGDKT